MNILNIRKKDIQGQTELTFDFYSDNLNNVMDSNIDDRISGRNNLL